MLQQVRLEVVDDQSARLTIGKQKFELALGKWSPVLEIQFGSGIASTVHVVSQVILTELKDRVSLYFTPLQIHPLHSPWHYGTPGSLIKDAWKVNPFLTLGWPQDTNALEDGCISDDQFFDLCASIFETRRRIFFSRLDRFKEGVLAAIFDDLDRVQHMFLRHGEDLARQWYGRLDAFVGEVQAGIDKLGLEKYRLLILSDHGFRNFEQKVNLNRWLVQNGYMTVKGAADGDLSSVDWSATRAYALGLNSLYLNVAGREGQGIVQATQLEALLEELKTKLQAWKDASGDTIISRVLLKHEAFNGPYTRLGPDLVIGYAPRFRASSETGLGRIGAAALEPNHDHWGADHCIDSNMVPGVLFSNRSLKEMPGLSYRDIPYLALGKHLDQSYVKPPSAAGPQGQGQKDLEERLKGLGYL
jgi:hypothetical protein